MNFECQRYLEHTIKSKKILSYEMALTAEVAFYFGAYEHYKHLAVSGKPLSLWVFVLVLLVSRPCVIQEIFHRTALNFSAALFKCWFCP